MRKNQQKRTLTKFDCSSEVDIYPVNVLKNDEESILFHYFNTFVINPYKNHAETDYWYYMYLELF